jgi:general nucleoside transport system permease protein
MKIGKYLIVTEKRLEIRTSTHVVYSLLALIASLAVSALLIGAANSNPVEAFMTLYKGAFGSGEAFVGSLVKATPLILTGLAVSVAFHGRAFNIGVEGQLFAGAITGYGVHLALVGASKPVMILGVLLAGIIGGALAGLIPALLKIRFDVDIIISTVMLNYIIGLILSLLLSASGPWRDPEAFFFQSPFVDESSRFIKLIPDMKLHIGFILAILVGILMYVLIKRTALGFDIRAIGLNAIAATFKGISSARTLIMAMLISGGIAGLVGVGELFGIHYRLKPEISNGYGFTGIMIAMLGNLHPFGVILAAILFGALNNGSFKMQVATGVPIALVFVIQAIILIFFLISRALAGYKIRVKKYVE